MSITSIQNSLEVKKQQTHELSSSDSEEYRRPAIKKHRDADSDSDQFEELNGIAELSRGSFMQ